jgi:hypothetical protein
LQDHKITVHNIIDIGSQLCEALIPLQHIYHFGLYLEQIYINTYVNGRIRIVLDPMLEERKSCSGLHRLLEESSQAQKDVWDLGIVMVELLTGKPIPGVYSMPDQQVIDNILASINVSGF